MDSTLHHGTGEGGTCIRPYRPPPPPPRSPPPSSSQQDTTVKVSLGKTSELPYRPPPPPPRSPAPTSSSQEGSSTGMVSMRNNNNEESRASKVAVVARPSLSKLSHFLRTSIGSCKGTLGDQKQLLPTTTDFSNKHRLVGQETTTALEKGTEECRQTTTVLDRERTTDDVSFYSYQGGSSQQGGDKVQHESETVSKSEAAITCKIRALRYGRIPTAMFITGTGMYAFYSIDDMTIKEVVLSFYFMVFGSLLFVYETEMRCTHGKMKKYFGFLDGQRGRGLYLIFVGVLCFELGILPAIASGVAGCVMGVLQIMDHYCCAGKPKSESRK